MNISSSVPCQRYKSKKTSLPIPTIEYITPNTVTLPEFLSFLSPLIQSTIITIFGTNFRNNTVVTLGLGEFKIPCETIYNNSNVMGFYIPEIPPFLAKAGGVYPVQVYNPNPQPNPGTLNTIGLTSNVVFLMIE